MSISFRCRRHSVIRGIAIGALVWIAVVTVLSLRRRQSDPEPEKPAAQHHVAVQVDKQKANIDDHNEKSTTRQSNKVEDKDVRPENHETPPKEENKIEIPEHPKGYGEMGRAVVLNLTKQEQEIRDKLFKRHYLDEYVSDLVSLHRTLPDVRNPGCKEVKYPIASMPQAAVVVCFHNEAFSILMRTVHSILDRSPPELLKEIILVDDYSSLEDMGKRLEDYVAHLSKVKLLRTKKREGLIRGRLLGAQSTSADILVFLDSHCECTQGWLEPIVHRIYENKTYVVVPVIDVIDDHTLQYMPYSESRIQVGGFDWSLTFTWHMPPAYELRRRKNSWDPIRTPTMAGGLFAISRQFFEYLGTYDAAMDYWGGENVELSFKTWLCGGTLEILPCSHVGHIFRSQSPHKWPISDQTFRKNTLRVALVWMDDYAKYFFERIGEKNLRPEIYGDISERVALRKRLKCKSFDYFVQNIWPEIFIPGNSIAKGEIRNIALGNNTCLDLFSDHDPESVKMYTCHGQRGNQFFMYTIDGKLRQDDTCLDYLADENQKVVSRPCHGSFGSQAWFYELESQQIKHNVSSMCMGIKSDKTTLSMELCDVFNPRQKWMLENFNTTAYFHAEKRIKRDRFND